MRKVVCSAYSVAVSKSASICSVDLLEMPQLWTKLIPLRSRVFKLNGAAFNFQSICDHCVCLKKRQAVWHILDIVCNRWATLILFPMSHGPVVVGKHNSG